MSASTLKTEICESGLISVMTLASRIQEAIQGKTQAEIARATGRTEGAVTQWLDGSTKSLKANTAALLEAATGYSATWIVTGRGERRVSNIRPMPAAQAVPVISSVRAGTWGEINDHEPDSEEVVYAREVKPSRTAFALRVEGDSMTSSDGRSFPDGTIIIVEPEKAPKAGDYVVAKDVVTQRATFKKLATDGARWYLRALNRDYPTIEIDDPALRVIGVVVEYWTGGKL
jgi:SOS-response transcriptional repressor LexA